MEEMIKAFAALSLTDASNTNLKALTNFESSKRNEYDSSKKSGKLVPLILQLLGPYLAWIKEKLEYYSDVDVRMFFKMKIAVEQVENELMAKVYLNCRFKLKFVNDLVNLGGMVEVKMDNDLANLLVSKIKYKQI